MDQIASLSMRTEFCALLFIGFYPTEVVERTAVYHFRHGSLIWQCIQILQHIQPQHQLDSVRLVPALSFIIARSDFLHGISRSICSKNSFFFVLACDNSSISPDRLICSFMSLCYLIRFLHATCFVRCCLLFLTCDGMPKVDLNYNSMLKNLVKSTTSSTMSRCPASPPTPPGTHSAPAWRTSVWIPRRCSISWATQHHHDAGLSHPCWFLFRKGGEGAAGCVA